MIGTNISYFCACACIIYTEIISLTKNTEDINLTTIILKSTKAV